MSMAIEPTMDILDIMKRKDSSLRKSLCKNKIRESKLHSVWDTHKSEISIEEKCKSQTIQVEFSKKKGKKWKTLVDKRLK